MKKYIALIIVVALVFTFVVASEGFESQYFDQVKQFILTNYKFDVTEVTLLDGAIKRILAKEPNHLQDAISGMMGQLDEHSSYLTQDELEIFRQGLSSKIAGLGVKLEDRNGKIAVKEVLRFSPAEKAGLKSGDIIVEVNGKNTEGLAISELRPLLIGESGTVCNIVVSRQGQRQQFSITREYLTSETLRYGIAKPKLGIITMDAFADTTASEMKLALDYMDGVGIKKIILDLRDNPGGLVQTAVDIGNLILPSGKIMSIEYKNENVMKTQVFYSNNMNAKYYFYVLTNENTASAAEFLSGAIQDKKVGVVIGEKSYGKGTMQVLVPLTIGGAMKLTVAQYKTPNGRILDGVGVIPDYPVKNIIYKVSEDPRILPMKFNTEINAKSPENEIKALEQRLNILGYYIGNAPDGVFDQNTKEAIEYHQKKYKLKITGVADIYTQMSISDASKDIKVVNDLQYEKAMSFVK